MRWARWRRPASLERHCRALVFAYFRFNARAARLAEIARKLAAGAQWRLTLPDVLRRSARDSQIYQDAALLQGRFVVTPRRAALRLQVELPI